MVLLRSSALSPEDSSLQIRVRRKGEMRGGSCSLPLPQPRIGAFSSAIDDEKKGVWLRPRVLKDSKEHGADARNYTASILRILGVAEGDE